MGQLGLRDRPGAALMGAWLERDISGRAARRMSAGSGIAQRHDLAVGTAGGLCVPLTNDMPLRVDQYAADRRIGRGQQPGLGGQFEGAFDHDDGSVSPGSAALSDVRRSRP